MEKNSNMLDMPLRHGSKPRYETIAAVLRALNVRIAVEVK